jgi:hypothetical protein
LIKSFNLFKPIGVALTINQKNLHEIATKAVQASLERNGVLPRISIPSSQKLLEVVQ